MAGRLKNRGAVMAGVLAGGWATAIVNAQCQPRWSAYSGPQLDDGVLCLSTWDPDGPGPAPTIVVAGGNFSHLGPTPMPFVGGWDGSAWRGMGAGVDGTVTCVTSFGAGQDPPSPVIGGYFTMSGTTVVNRIARFSGGAWQPLGSGVSEPGLPYVTAVSAYSGGLAVGGIFDTAGGVSVVGLARWDGTVWHAFPDQHAGVPDTFAYIGGTLYAGGLMPAPGYSGILTSVLRWSDPSWVLVGQDRTNWPNDDAYALALFGGQLYAGGVFWTPGVGIAAFDGTAWQPVGGGTDGAVYALCEFAPNGPGTAPDLLIAGGSFAHAGGQPANNIAAWDGTHWTPLGSGTSDTVRALTVWRNELVVAGDFFSAGGLVSPGMAFWGCPQPALCYANCDQSTTPPILNVNDFGCFLSAFASGSPYANCDNSTAAPVLNVNDFVCFIYKFAQGCP